MGGETAETVTAGDTALHAVAAMARALPGVSAVDVRFDQVTAVVPPDRWFEAVKSLRDDALGRFVCFVDLCGVDHPTRPERFEVVLHLLSPSLNERIRLKTSLAEATPLASICELFPAANWFEREAYDLYGILFAGHPDLRRLLTDYGFEGHPLRKDFPLTGFVEVRYDDAEKRVVYDQVRLQQEFRNFDFLSPWEGMDRLLPGDEKAPRGA